MRIEPFIQFIKQVHGKVNSSNYTSLQGQSNPQHIAFLRQVEKERKLRESLSVPLNELNVVALDLETTGFNPDQGDVILSIGAIKVKGESIQHDETYYSLVRCNRPIPVEVMELTGIKEEDVKQAPKLSEVLIKFYKFVQGDVLVAHHAHHEKQFLQYANWKLFRSSFKHRIIDISFLSKYTEPTSDMVRLEEHCKHCGIPVSKRHHALGDAKMAAQLWSVYLNRIQTLGCNTLYDLYEQLSKKL